MLCDYNPTCVSNALKNVTNYAAGVPLTVIAIDKENDDRVAKSWSPFFPPAQLPNLYQVHEIEKLLENINTSIYFCLDFVPWFDHGTWTAPEPVWYYYLAGALLLTVLLIFAIIVIKRHRKRSQKIKEISVTPVPIATIHTMVTENQYSIQPKTADVWEVSIDLLDINYENPIGKGAFSVVHSGFLRGKAPILNIFPSIAMQQFTDCAVAVKMLPLHSDENARIKFRDEISLMKKIGYHFHLISMLGCNCSIERSILVLERAKYNLLEWLTLKRGTIAVGDINMEKTLLSLSWQIADGMVYFSSKRFIHRDLAARNILLDTQLKAMISDFGLCKSLEDNEQVLTITGEKLPLKWMALESLQHQKFSKKTDVWSFGVLLFEIFSLGREPYSDIAVDKLITFLQNGNRLEKPSFANELTYDCMKQCWHFDTAQRPDFCRIQSHFARLLEDRVENYGYLSTTAEHFESEINDSV